MDTKWKRTVKNIKGFFKKNKKAWLGVILIIISLGLFYALYYSVSRYYMGSRLTLALGILLNIILAFGIKIIVPRALSCRYENWIPENSDFYISWKTAKESQNRKIYMSGGILLLLSVIFLIRMMGYYSGYYFPNFSFGYLLIGTVVFQFAIMKSYVNKFMNAKLDELMACVNEVNKDRLREAIEKERESIERAAKSEQLKVDLISNVSHDLKTPLTSMVGYLELLKKEELNEVQRDYVEIISSRTEKLKEMVESLFSLAKASSGNMNFHKEPIGLNRLIGQLFADLDDKVEESNLKFVINLTEEDTHMVTDNIHMYRICQNLIENTLKYSAEGTRVFVKTFIEKGQAEKNLCLEVTNTAGYLMDFSKEDIVERFARGDKARSGDGNGLGLAIVSTYAGALGGSFDINIDCDQFKAILRFPIEES